MRTAIPVRLSLYFSRIYVVNVLLALVSMLSIIWLFDSVELLRRAGRREDVHLSTILEMALLKLPDVGQIVLPFAILFAAMFTFWQLARRGELVAARACGLSVWQFLAPIIGVALVAGALHPVLVNPAGALLLERFEQMERAHLGRQKALASLFEGGVWLRQEAGVQEHSDAILHAARIDLPQWTLSEVSVFFFAGDGGFSGRIDARAARLEPEEWVLSDAEASFAGREPQRYETYRLPTSLTQQEIEESFSSPESLSFWRLPGHIRVLEGAGFDATRLRIHFQALLSQPLLFAAMVLLAAAVSLRPPRARSSFGLIALGLAIGFAVFFLSGYLQALGVARQIPALLAAWSPALVTFLFGLGVLLRTEDG